MVIGRCSIGISEHLHSGVRLLRASGTLHKLRVLASGGDFRKYPREGGIKRNSDRQIHETEFRLAIERLIEFSCRSNSISFVQAIIHTLNQKDVCDT